MIKNYLKVAIRNLKRQPGYSIINILGLAIGLACFMIIMQYVRDEKSYDQCMDNGDQLYRVALERIYPGRERHYAIIPHSYAGVMKQEYPEVKEACRVFYFQQAPIVIKHNDNIYEEEHWIQSDSTFFDVFDFQLLAGSEKTALTQPFGVVLTESIAKKYFGDEDPMGKTLEMPQNNAGNDLIVTGICEDVPENSHLVFDMIVSVVGVPFFEQPNFIGFSAYTYLLLENGTNPRALEAKFPDLVTKYASGQILTNFGVDYEEYQNQGNGYVYTLQSVPDIYLQSNLEGEMKPPGSKQRISFFTIISIMILIIACINFMNLATARSATRAREVGIRKTMGSARIQIAAQFFAEAILISFVAALIAYGIHHTVLPLFNHLTGKSFGPQSLTSVPYFSLLLSVTTLAGVFSGIYPAIALSAFKPIEVLRGHFSQSKKGSFLRNALVVFQFGVSVFLIISTIIVYQQMLFTQNKELGFDKEHLITLQGAGGMTESQGETFKNELRNLQGVTAVSGCSSQPGNMYFGVSFKPPEDNEMTTGSGLFVDENYIDCMEMELVAGRGFRQDFADSLSLVLNEAAVQELGLENPVGSTLISPSNQLNNQGDDPLHFRVIGVIKDFHFQSLHQRISPLFLINHQFGFNPGVDNLIAIRLKPNAFPNTIASIETIWTNFQPDLPFRYAFLDKDWANLYHQEITARKVFSTFSVLAIFIACLGLLALAAFTAEQRVKEIGIRKVLGATSLGIVGLLSRDFLRLVVLAIVVASPLAWYAMNNWLEDFAYRVELNWWVFVIAGLIAILIAFITVSFQSVKAAIANPAESLKNE